MIVNYKEDESQLEIDNKAVIEIEIDDSDFDEMADEAEEEGFDYD